MLKLSHKTLDVYQLSLKLVKEVYILTSTLPTEERYGLSSQLRRAAVSVCSNIAEGAARASKQEKKRFYEVASSSVVEIDTQFEIIIMLNYWTRAKVKDLEQYLESIFRMLSKMIDNLMTPPTSHSPLTISNLPK